MKVSNKYSKEEKIMVVTSETLNTLKKVEDRKFKLIITSPPYNIGKEYEDKKALKEYLDEQEEIIRELIRVLDDDGSICWQVGNYVDKGEVLPLDIYFYPMFKNHGLKLRNRIIWRFGHGLHAKNRFSGRYETILWFTKSDNYIFNLDDVRIPSKYPGKRYYKGDKKGQLSGNPRGKNPSDIWDIVVSDWDTLIWDIPNVKSNHPEKTLHPCQFPVELVERCILALTNEDDYVLDPFGGVGSTAIAAIKNQRNVLCIDRESEYTKVARRNIKLLFEGKLKTREIGTKIHVPSPTDKVAKYPEEWEKRD